MNNIVLIGMPGSGKSTVGVLLAKALLMDFVDTDLVIQQRTGSALCDIIAKKGVEYFKQLECDIICAVNCTNSVIATGGSAVYGDEAMRHLRRDSRVVYLKVPVDELSRRIDNISTRGIAMEEGVTLGDLYGERAPLYERYADVTVDCAGMTAEQCVGGIIAALGGRTE
ncbi:MAG: shikimate kinase [Firmicutes bacterium]|nr:shikimate kinase [Bacillota bacterium]